MHKHPQTNTKEMERRFKKKIETEMNVHMKGNGKDIEKEEKKR